jgi:cytochrome c oxidase subunit 4
MATAHSRTEHDDTGHDDTEPAGAARYWLTWAALLVGTIATLLMSRVPLPHPWHLLVALFIACAKSALVVLFFMHLWDHGGANRLVFASAVFFVVLLIGIVVLDNATRFALLNPGHDEATLRMEPPGPELLTPHAPPAETAPKSPAPAPRE